jgi:uncharacterized damage-inducible protein DinB
VSKQLVDRYAAGAGVPGQWIKGLTREDLAAVPVPGKWSVQQLIQHVLDSDLIASHRMKRIIAEENPLLISYDETRFAQKLGYDKLDPQLACDLFRLNRELTAQILRQQPESAFERTGIHNERGRMSLRECVELYVEHLEHHKPFLVEKRERLGKPL